MAFGLHSERHGSAVSGSAVRVSRRTTRESCRPAVAVHDRVWYWTTATLPAADRSARPATVARTSSSVR
jgi:hypothetical protein